jgi:hypothetical protein
MVAIKPFPDWNITHAFRFFSANACSYFWDFSRARGGLRIILSIGYLPPDSHHDILVTYHD